MRKDILKRAVKKTGEALKAFTADGLNDALIFGGAAVGIYATFRINTTAGFYALAGVLIFVGWYLTQHPLEKR